MGWKLITEPSVEPVSLAEAKTQLSIQDSIQDDVITRHITTARQHAEAFTGQAFITQVLEVAYDQFNDEILLPVQPYQSISSVYYVDTDGTTQIINASNYGVDEYSANTWLVPAASYDWPDTYDTINAVRVRYVAGYGDAGSDVPAPIRDAIIIAVNQLLKNADTDIGAPTLMLPRAFDQLLWPYKRVRT